MGFCAGCPHKASFWAIKKALMWDGRDGIVTGDIGCYTLALLPTGFSTAKTTHCMGAGIGVATGFGNLKKLAATYGEGLVNEIPILPSASATKPSLVINPKGCSLNPNFREVRQ